jgi:23S rRNA G2069 N7-methylase RlmK/C1962 C5-methylase RlmI
MLFIISTLQYQHSQAYFTITKRYISKLTKSLLYCSNNQDLSYEIIDCGNYKRLERFGSVIVSRTCPTASWNQALSPKTWKQAILSYDGESGKSGTWTGIDKIPSNWTVSLNNISFNLVPTSYGQIGIFPEQEENWKWIQNQLKQRIQSQSQNQQGNIIVQDLKQDKQLRVINGFGYTGI